MSDSVFNKTPITGLTPVDGTVRDQLKVRAELHSKTFEDPNFTQHYVNSNYAFVKVSSGIDITGVEDAAKKYQLLGGTLFEGKARKGINFKGEDFETSNNAYTFQKEGLVPQPGITGFNIQTQGAEGLLRMVDLSIKCFSVEQFSILEKLYMRPGFKLLFEWGHSVYVDQSGGKVYSPKTISDDTVFKNAKIATLKEEGGQLIYDSQHNYDYMIGTIMNYEWSYDNGQYNIEVQAMGMGGLSETQARMFKVGTETDTTPDGEADKELEFDNADKLEGSFTTIFKTISESAGRGRQSENKLIPIAVDQSRIDKGLKRRKVKKFVDDICSDIGDGFKLEVYKLDFKQSNSRKFTYIPFRFVLGCMNYFFLPKYEGEKDPEGKFCVESERNLYVTFDDHYSVDPHVCLLPGQSSSTPIETSALSGFRDASQFKGDLLDVWINTEYVYNKAKDIQKDTKSEPTVATFLDVLLSGLRTAMGGLNDFTLYNDFYLDKELGPTTVRDRQLPIDPSIKDEETVLQSMGKNSYVESFSFNTSIDQATLNAMTTQAVLSGTDAAKSLHKGISAYSIGLTDRFGEDKPLEKIKGQTADSAAQKKSVEEQYEQMFKKRSYIEDTIEKIKYSASDAQQILLSEKLSGEDKHTGFAIPGNISLVMKGIGGIKMLQFFKLPYDNLPDSYKDAEVVFMVTNISHSIDGGSWITDIEAQVQII
ncbi:hypothetical protein N9H35_00580 [bacterium]|nr:hypothetical protein [bacterium]